MIKPTLIYHLMSFDIKAKFNQSLPTTGTDPAKLDANTLKEGPLLVIAGPGSGKTKTIVERIVFLILEGIAPEKIMVATFTEKAPKELITRVSNRIGQLGLSINLNELYIGT